MSGYLWNLTAYAIQLAAIVTVTKSLSNSVTVAGEIVTGARIQLSVRGDRLLDVIAAAGGAKSPVYETFVRLSRGGITATIPMERLVSNPAENIYAQPGDVLALFLQQVDEERPCGAIEDTVDELAHHRSDDELLRTDWRVDVGPLAGLLLQVALGLEDVHHRLHGGVGEGAALAQLVVDLANGGLAERPDHLHDLELLGGQRVGLGPHTNYLVLMNWCVSSGIFSQPARVVLAS